jgi:uncharacterized protein
MSDPELPTPTPPEITPGSVASPPTPPPPPPHTVFRGPDGIRAGWRVLIFLAICAALFTALFVGVGIITHGRRRPPIAAQLTPSGLALTEGVTFLLVAIATIIMGRIERRQWGQYGLPILSAFKKDFWIGTIVGFTAISGCLLGIFALHGFRVTGLAIHGSLIPFSVAAWCLTFVVVGLSEEFTFRGYMQYTLTTGMGFWPSAILLSVLFAAAHIPNPGETSAGVGSVVLFGLLFCLFLRRRGNLWWPVGFHAGWDWGQTFFYGVPDSGLKPYHSLFDSAFSGPHWLTGGSVGPEASIFTPIVLLIVAIGFASVYRDDLYSIHVHPPVPEPRASDLSQT